MHNDEWKDVSLPEDFQIERSMVPGSQGEARLLQELQALYDGEKSASIERVWTRLVGQSAGTNVPVFANHQPEASDSKEQRLLSKRTTKRHLMNQRVPVSQKGLPRFLSLIAAACVCVLIVGSLAVVLNMLKGPHQPTNVGSQPATRTSTATATPLSSPECRDSSDQNEQQLCLAQAETLLTIHKTFGTHKVVFLRAYADSSRLLLVYTTSDPTTSDTISFESLSIQPKITLAAGGSTSYQNPKTHQAYDVASFDTQNIPAGTTQIEVQSIVDAFSGTATPLEFTVPLHVNQKTTIVNQTVTSKGVSLTLERVVNTGSETLIYFKPSQAAIEGLFVKSISFNGQPYLSSGSQIDSGGTVGSPGVIIHISVALNAPGTWTLKVASGGGTYSPDKTWTFTFTKSAN